MRSFKKIQELNTYCRSSGRTGVTFKDIAPFLTEVQLRTLESARIASGTIKPSADYPPVFSDSDASNIRRFLELGFCVCPSFFGPLLKSKELRVLDVPFNVVFTESSQMSIGGKCLHFESVDYTRIVLIGLTSAVKFLSEDVSNFISSNTQSVSSLGVFDDIIPDDISTRILTKPHNLRLQPSTLLDNILQIRCRLFSYKQHTDKDVTVSHLNLVNMLLCSYGAHEAFHAAARESILDHYLDNIEGEEFAYLLQIGYGPLGVGFGVLPLCPSPNRFHFIASNRIRDATRERVGFKEADFSTHHRYVSLTSEEISAIAKELLDEHFVRIFGKHHDQILPVTELENLRRFKFFVREDLPMIQAVLHVPELT